MCVHVCHEVSMRKEWQAISMCFWEKIRSFSPACVFQDCRSDSHRMLPSGPVIHEFRQSSVTTCQSIFAKLHGKTPWKGLDGLHCPIWYTWHFLDWHMVFPLGSPGSRWWYTLAGSQEKWAFPNQPVASGKPVLPVSSLLAPRPDPALWSLVGVLQLSLVDAKFSYCMWKHHGGEASKSQRPWGMLALHPTLCLPRALPARSKGVILGFLYAPCAKAATLEICFVQARRITRVEAPVIIALGNNLFLNWTVLFSYFSKTVINQHPLLHFS